MKQGIHPDYHRVVFRDRAAGFAFLTRSTAATTQTVTWEDGNTYPVIDVETSSASHPFYTGQARVLDTAGRVEQFRRRYGTNARGSSTFAS
jgi:large subunit ribosomal protein L31